MFDDVKGGLALAGRRWKQSTGIALIFAIISVVMSLILGDVLTQAGSLRSGASLRASRAVVLTPFHPAGKVSSTSVETSSLLGTYIRQDQAYSAVINNLMIEDPYAFGGVRTILIMGTRPFDLFPALGAGCEAPCVLRGSEVEAYPMISFRGLDVPVAGTLPRGAVWFEASAAGLNLDSSQILVLSPDQITLLDSYEKEELITRAVLLDPVDQDVEKLLSSSARDGLYLVPSNLPSDQSERFTSLMVQAAMYVIALLAFCGLAGFSYGVIMQEIIKQEARAFVIRRMCGAPSYRLNIRLFVFLATAAVIPPLGICGALWLVGPPVAVGAEVMALIIVMVYIILETIALRTIRRLGV